jgi:hypothetical protein
MRVFVLLCFASLLIAGCTGGDSTGATAQSSSASATYEPPTADTASVKGLIVDDEEKPVVGARIALLDVPGRDVEATSDAAGGFGFGDLPPGSYRLAVSQLGYEAFVRKVDLVGGETTEVKVVLKPIAVVTGTHDTKEIAGFLGCSATVYTAQSARPQQRLVCAEVAAGQSWYPNHKNDHKWTVPKGYATHLAELDWKANTASAKELLFLITTSLDCTPAVCLVSSSFSPDKTGPRPLSIRTDAKSTLPNGPVDVFSKAFSGVSSGATPTAVVVLDQKYTIYVTNFFGEPMPEVWTATPPEPV